jgi:predicted transcriptional regulator
MENKKVTKLKAIVNTAFQLSLTRSTRKKEYIWARAIFCIILREEGYTLTFLANNLGLNHSTIINYINKKDGYFYSYKMFRDMYSNIREEYYNYEDPLYEMNNLDLKKCVLNLREQINILNLRNAELINTIESDTKYSKLFNIVRERTKPKTENDMEFKLNRFYNGVYS